MLVRFSEAIVEALQSGMDVPKGRVGLKSPAAKQKLPYVHVSNVSFEVKDGGLGGSVGGEGVTVSDRFDGDGVITSYTLTEKPMRPLVSVESPPGSRVHPNQYVVDYLAGTVTFNKPPKKGERNVVMLYRKPYLSRGINLELTYNVIVWEGDEEARDRLATAAMQALLKAEETLNSSGIFLKPVRGYNVDQGLGGGYGKAIEYSVEGEVRVDIEVGRIESIDMTKPRRV